MTRPRHAPSSFAPPTRTAQKFAYNFSVRRYIEVIEELPEVADMDEDDLRREAGPTMLVELS